MFGIQKAAKYHLKETRISVSTYLYSRLNIDRNNTSSNVSKVIPFQGFPSKWKRKILSWQGVRGLETIICIKFIDVLDHSCHIKERESN